MAVLSYHGGRCCGINHMHSFNGTETVEDIKKLIASTRQRATRGMLIEAVLTNGQCNYYPSLLTNLQKVGFKLVSRFLNPNSGNICNVFHYNNKPRSLTSRLPFPIVEQLPVAQE